MPPSTTPATSQNHGQCVVCGKETSMGCGDCKRGGLTWMYFCSVDHQRLIWKIHKRVCGKNPFEWPPLNDSEAEEIFELRNELCSTTEWKNLLEMIADTYGGRPDCDKAVAFENMLKFSKLPASAIAVSDLIPDRSKPTVIQVRAWIRVLVFNTRMHQLKIKCGAQRIISPENTQRLFLDHPFDLVLHIIEAHTGSRKANDHPCWRSDYLHRLLIFVAILAASLNPDATLPGYGNYLRHTALACAAVNTTASVKLGGSDCDELVGMLVSFVSVGVGISENGGDVD